MLQQQPENLYKIPTYEVQYLQPEELQRWEESQLLHMERQGLFLGHLGKRHTLYRYSTARKLQASLSSSALLCMNWKLNRNHQVKDVFKATLSFFKKWQQPFPPALLGDTASRRQLLTSSYQLPSLFTHGTVSRSIAYNTPKLLLSLCCKQNSRWHSKHRQLLKPSKSPHKQPSQQQHAATNKCPCQYFAPRFSDPKIPHSHHSKILHNQTHWIKSSPPQLPGVVTPALLPH